MITFANETNNNALLMTEINLTFNTILLPCLCMKCRDLDNNRPSKSQHCIFLPLRYDRRLPSRLLRHHGHHRQRQLLHRRVVYYRCIAPMQIQVPNLTKAYLYEINSYTVKYLSKAEWPIPLRNTNPFSQTR